MNCLTLAELFNPHGGTDNDATREHVYGVPGERDDGCARCRALVLDLPVGVSRLLQATWARNLAANPVAYGYGAATSVDQA